MYQRGNIYEWFRLSNGALFINEYIRETPASRNEYNYPAYLWPS